MAPPGADMFYIDLYIGKKILSESARPRPLIFGM